jgi:hypothetical protein
MHLKKYQLKFPELFKNFNILDVSSKKEYVIVQSKYGLHNIRIYNLAKGAKLSIVNAIDKTEYFINFASEIHNNLYDYSLVNYISNKIKVKIISSEGIFEQTPGSHLSGCGCPKLGSNSTAIKQSSNTEEFIKKAKKIHGDKYDYSLVDYKNASSKVKVISKHGVFEVTPHNHLRGKGCPILAKETISIKKGKNSTWWQSEKWEKAAEKSKNFDFFKLYIIKCYNEAETFYKIGKTFKTIKKRFWCKRSMPYNYEIIKIITGTAKEISELEEKIKEKNKDYSYIPIIKFGGFRECFFNIFL